MIFKPKISVLLPINKDRGYLDPTIKSVLDQSFKDFELIIILNNYTEDLYEKVKEWAKADDRIKVVIYPKREEIPSITRVLNKGLEVSKANIIARIDEGSMWIDKNKLKNQYKILLKENLVLIGSYCEKCINDNCFFNTLPIDDLNIRKAFLKALNPFLHPTVLFRKALKYNPFLPRSQDFELWLRLSFIGKMKILPKPMVREIYLKNSLTLDPYSSYIQFLSYKEIYKTFLKSLENKQYRITFVKGEIHYNIPYLVNKNRCANLKIKSFFYKMIYNICNPENLKFTLYKKVLYPFLVRKYKDSYLKGLELINGHIEFN